jgi:hypothetical protein
MASALNCDQIATWLYGHSLLRRRPSRNVSGVSEQNRRRFREGQAPTAVLDDPIRRRRTSGATRHSQPRKVSTAIGAVGCVVRMKDQRVSPTAWLDMYFVATGAARDEREDA